MKCTIGLTDKMVKILLGLCIGCLALYFKNWWPLLATLLISLSSFCKLYTGLRLNICSIQGDQ